MGHPKEVIYELPRHHFIEAYKASGKPAIENLKLFLAQVESSLDEVYKLVSDAASMDKCDTDAYGMTLAKLFAAYAGLKESFFVEAAQLQMQNIMEILKTIDKANQILPEKVAAALPKEKIIEMISKT